MKRLLLIAFSALFLACNNDPRAKMTSTGSFGEKFEIANDMKEINTLNLSDSSIYDIHQISGTIEKYCKGEGCWMTLKANNSFVRVDTKDKKFVLPKNIDGKKAIANGQFILEDNELSFEATGIVIE